MEKIQGQIKLLKELKFQIDMKDVWEAGDSYQWDELTKMINDLEEVLEYAQNNPKFKMCLEVAEQDYLVGISSAMETLNKYGYETPIYWAFLKQVQDNEMDFDEYTMSLVNIDCRDLQYEVLGIYYDMDIAQDIVWEYDCTKFKAREI